jgi:hypothetical protein
MVNNVDKNNENRFRNPFLILLKIAMHYWFDYCLEENVAPWKERLAEQALKRFFKPINLMKLVYGVDTRNGYFSIFV